jgi:ADP-heptose:LPS heptosyltransferase
MRTTEALNLPKKILVYRIGQLGDALVAAPAIWAVREQFPGVQMDLLTNFPPVPEAVTTYEVYKNAAIFSRTHFYPNSKNALARVFEMIALRSILVQSNYDSLAYLAPTARKPWQICRDRAFFKSIGIRKIWGIPLSESVKGTGGEAEKLLDGITSSGEIKKAVKPRYDLGLTTQEIKTFKRKYLGHPDLASKTLVAVCPFSRMPAKRWPLDRFVTVLQELMWKKNCYPILVGGPEDNRDGAYVLDRLGAGLNLAGELHVRETAGIMGFCQFYLGNDTGAMHIAASVGIPCVAIFSARTTKGSWYPAGEGNRILRKDVPCQLCELYDCKKERMRCLTEIDESEVLAEIEKVLQNLGKA